MIGQVTAVISSIRRVAWAAAPSTDHAKGAWPCSSSHGKKWSEIAAKANPACSARTVLRTRAVGPCSSAISLYPSLTISRSPRRALVPSGKQPEAVGFRIAAKTWRGLHQPHDVDVKLLV